MSENVTIRDGWTAAALAAAAGRPASEVASVAGVTERTIRRWNRRPAFKQLVEEVRAQLLFSTLGRLLDKNAAAVDALSGLLKSQQEHVVLGAAGRLLELTLRVRKQLDTERELEEIKADWKAFQSEHPSLFPKETPIRDRQTND